MIGGQLASGPGPQSLLLKARLLNGIILWSLQGQPPPRPVDKVKKVVKKLSSAPDNEFLNAAEVTPESTPASAAKILCEKMFGGILDASDPRFLALVSHLAYSTKQRAIVSSHPLDDLGDSLKDMFLIVSHLLFSRIILTPLTFFNFVLIFLTLFLFFCGRPSGNSWKLMPKIGPSRDRWSSALLRSTGIRILLPLIEARTQIIGFQGQIEDLTKQLGKVREKFAQASQRVSTVESQRDEALA